MADVWGWILCLFFAVAQNVRYAHGAVLFHVLMSGKKLTFNEDIWLVEYDVYKYSGNTWPVTSRATRASPLFELAAG